jgi:predicted transcriptional regulator of viral defense system
MDRLANAAAYLDALAASGRYHFSTEEAAEALRRSAPAVRAALRRLKAKRLVADPYRGFHVIVPPEYRKLGCLPPEQFIPQLMQHLGEPYYVALLSAAELHGAAHHRPQRFQIMLRSNRRGIDCGQVCVQFIARKDLEHTPCIERRTPRGAVRVASPEATALELVGYAVQCGGLDNVASVVAELAEDLDALKLVEAAKTCPVVWSQRLGHLLDQTGHQNLGDALAEHVAGHATVVAPLVRARSRAGAERVDRWKLAVNATLEIDE